VLLVPASLPSNLPKTFAFVCVCLCLQVFIPSVKPFLLRLADTRSLLAQPPPSVLAYLQQPHGPLYQQHHHQGSAAAAAAAAAAGGFPAPPSLMVSGAHAALMQVTANAFIAACLPGIKSSRDVES
jgi:hypothetical protein